MSDPALRKALAAGAAGLLGGGCVLGIATMLGAPGLWLAASAAGLVGAGAVLIGAHLAQRGPAEPPAVPADGHSSQPADQPRSGTIREGGVLPVVEAMLRFEEEVALAARYGRPLCIALAGIDVRPGLDVEDAMEGLRQLISGAVRRNDMITDRDPTSILFMAAATPAPLGWILVDRIQQRVASAGVSTVRFVLVGIREHDSLRSALDELDGGLQVCRMTDALVADPARMLAARA